MSEDGTKLFFEGFLQKRKDTMKIRWVTYWFRLQNTTLFFYTKKNGSASHLRGYYYIYTVQLIAVFLHHLAKVQSVREVQRPDSSRRFMFEITMKNGKRKILAAETAALRTEWLEQLWNSMHLSSCRSSDCGDTTSLGEGEQQDGRNSSTHLRSHGNTVMESLPARLISAPYSSVQIHCNTSGIVASPTILSQELNISTQICESNISTLTNEGVYDTPLSYRRPAAPQVPTESIYDIPSSHLRQVSDPITEEHYESVCWRM